MKTENDNELIATIRNWAAELGFQDIGFTGVDLGAHEGYLQKWLDAGYEGTMDWMARHGTKRSRPQELVPGTCTVISCRMDYLPEAEDSWEVMASSDKGFISRYALGRDYHKLIRSRLAKLAERIRTELASGEFRAFVDSAPVLERAIAEQAGMGWIAKNSMLINESAGSWFFLGEIYTDIHTTTPFCAQKREALWQLQCLPRSLPNGCVRGAVCFGCAALHFLSHHRA